MREDIKVSLAGNNFKKVRDLIKIDKDNLSIATISNDDLNKALDGIQLSKDEQALLNGVVNTINSQQVHYAEFKEKNEWISDFGINAMKVDVSYYDKNLVKGLTGLPDAEIEPGKVPAVAFFLLHGAVTSAYMNGSYSLIPKRSIPGIKSDYFKKDGTPTDNPFLRYTMHEVFGHGRMIALKIVDQHTQVIQFENLILRVMKVNVYRDGSNHENINGSRSKVENKDDIPAFLNQKN